MSDRTTDAADPVLRERAEEPYAAIRCDVADGVRAAVDRAFPELFAGLGERGLTPAGAPLIRYLRLDGDGEPLLLDVGVPVVADDRRAIAAAPQPPDGLRSEVLPAGRYATLLHAGPYSHATVPDLADARDRLLAWLRAEGFTTGDQDGTWEPPGALERFLVGPVDDPDWTRWRTEIAWRVG
jgi:hypothetical protein